MLLHGEPLVEGLLTVPGPGPGHEGAVAHRAPETAGDRNLEDPSASAGGGSPAPAQLGHALNPGTDQVGHPGRGAGLGELHQTCGDFPGGDQLCSHRRDERHRPQAHPSMDPPGGTT